MKKWEFTNLVAVHVSAEVPESWPDKEESKHCPPGWLLIIDAQLEVVAIAPVAVALMLVQLFAEIPRTNQWTPLDSES